MTTATAVMSTTVGLAPVEGVVCGAVLRACRKVSGPGHLTQERMAERLFVDINTYRSWEHGRRTLTRLSVHRFKSLIRALHSAGIPAELVELLDVAADVDMAIGRAAASEDNPLPPSDRCNTWHQLLAWTLLGTPPHVLAAGRVSAPRLSVPDRNALLKRIRYAAIRPDGRLSEETVAMLRRIYIDGLPAPVDQPPLNPAVISDQVRNLAEQLLGVAGQLDSTGGTK